MATTHGVILPLHIKHQIMTEFSQKNCFLILCYKRSKILCLNNFKKNINI